jgi:6-pyruvoyltetrahydropterin/6-carboxytetrahydropterin synthase
MHGHRYDIRIEISGAVDPVTGWILDYADARKLIDPFIGKLDHATLNSIPKLENPTCEHITLWIRDWLWISNFAPSRIEVRETERAGCVWTN